MSVEIYKNKEDQTIVDYICIDRELPNIEELSSVKSIRHLSIRNIVHSSELQEFLSRIPIDTIKRLEITSCNMQNIDLRFFQQLQSIEDVYIEQSHGINYSEVLKLIPNKEQVRSILLWADKQEKNNMNLQLLGEFKNLQVIGLRNFSEMNMDELHSCLLKAQELQQLVIEGEIKSLDFISGVELEHITIIDENLDLSLITPEIARRHTNICFTTGMENIITDAKNDGQTYELQFSSDYSRRLDVMEELIGNATRVKMNGNDILINNKEELKSLIKNKHILKRSPWLSIKVPHMGIIEPGELQEIENEVSINKIIVMDPDYEGPTKAVEYTRQQYEILHNRIQEIVGDIPKTFTDLQKFMVIYQRLGSTITYDNELVREDKDRDEEYIERNKYAGRNLINGLIKRKCVCVGYAEILYNCLQTVGIENCKIGSKTHMWNKVKLDDVWYNVDLTNDCDAIVKHNARGLEKCLRNEKAFEGNEMYQQTEGQKIQCHTDYPRKEIVKAMRFAERFSDRAIDAEYETIEESHLFSKLKARIMTLFGKRKMIGALQVAQSTPSESERRKAWTEKSGIVLDNGEEISTADIEKIARETKQYEHEQ